VIRQQKNGRVHHQQEATGLVIAHSNKNLNFILLQYVYKETSPKILFSSWINIESLVHVFEQGFLYIGN
jgi:hypothetical protein